MQKEITKALNKNIEALTASKVIQATDKLTLSDLKLKGKDKLNKAKEMMKEKELKKKARVVNKTVEYQQPLTLT